MKPGRPGPDSKLALKKLALPQSKWLKSVDTQSQKLNLVATRRQAVRECTLRIDLGDVSIFCVSFLTAAARAFASRDLLMTYIYVASFVISMDLRVSGCYMLSDKACSVIGCPHRKHLALGLFCGPQPPAVPKRQHKRLAHFQQITALHPLHLVDHHRELSQCMDHR